MTNEPAVSTKNNATDTQVLLGGCIPKLIPKAWQLWDTDSFHFGNGCVLNLWQWHLQAFLLLQLHIAAISYQASCWASTTYGRCLRCLLAHPIPQRPVVAFFAVIWSPFFSLEHVDFARDFCSFFSEFLWCQQILLEPEGFVLFTVPAFVGYTFGWQKTVEE